MADLVHIMGKSRRQRLMFVSVALLVVTILMAGISLIVPLALAQGYDDWGSSSGCCCCCGAAILPLACVGLTYAWQDDRKDGQ